jgi:hypothetical protein
VRKETESRREKKRTGGLEARIEKEKERQKRKTTKQN